MGYAGGYWPFQSPCAGNMFGKYGAPHAPAWDRALQGARFNPRVRGTCLVRHALSFITTMSKLWWFQSPCAGNMFGKAGGGDVRERLGAGPQCSFNPRVRGTCLVRSFADRPQRRAPQSHVSIPVCGEHVW